MLAGLVIASVASSAPVVGGTPVSPGEWPDAVAVLGTRGTCTGTLIAPDLVLTAGHCAEIEPARIVAGSTSFTSGGEQVPVAQVITYPDWQHSYDAAVLVLAQPVPDIAPRALARECTFDSFAQGTQVRLVGFGLTDPDGTGANTTLRQAMAAVDDPFCSDGHGCRASIAPGGEFVAGGGDVNSCFGDSGGPVYLDTPAGAVAIGAVSRGVDGSSTPCGGGGIYVRTDKLADWIESQTGRTLARDGCADTAAAAAPASAGCSAAGGGGGVGSLGLVAMAYASGCGLTRRRRRPRR